MKEDKIVRVLQIYAKLSDGYVVNRSDEAQCYGVNERSVQRDIDDIRRFLDADFERTGNVNSVVYDRQCKGYRLETLYNLKLKNSEVLALCKILLDRLPTAQILDEEDGVYTASAEVFGKGIDMWVRSQGGNIQII